MHLGHWLSLLSSLPPSSVLEVGFGWEVHQLCSLGIEHKWFAHTNTQPGSHCPMARESWSVGAQVLCPDHDELEGLKDTQAVAQSPVSHILRKKGPSGTDRMFLP